MATMQHAIRMQLIQLPVAWMTIVNSLGNEVVGGLVHVFAYGFEGQGGVACFDGGDDVVVPVYAHVCDAFFRAGEHDGHSDGPFQ